MREEKPIYKIGEIVTGSTPSKKKNEYYGNSYPLYKPTDLNEGLNITEARDNLSELGLKKARLLPAGSVLVTCIGATIGKTGLISREGASNQQINSIIPNQNYDSRYIYYQVISLDFQKKILDNASSTTLPILNKSKFSRLLFKTASLKEQHRIVEKIEELFTILDAAVTELKNVKKQLKRYRQSVLKSAFEGKLTEKWRESNSISKKEWSLLSLSLLTEEIDKINSKSKTGKRFYYYDIGGINNHTNEIESFKEYSWDVAPSRARQVLKKGDILFSTVRTYLRNIAQLKNNFPNQIGSTGFCVLRGKKDILESKYLFNYCLTERFLNPLNELQTGSSYPAVRNNDVLSQLIHVPSIEEQQKVVEEIESRLSVADKIEEEIDRNLKKTEQLRQSILKKAFEGKLVPQDPSDEPAEKLLERIKKEGN